MGFKSIKKDITNFERRVRQIAIRNNCSCYNALLHNKI